MRNAVDGRKLWVSRCWVPLVLQPFTDPTASHRRMEQRISETFAIDVYGDSRSMMNLPYQQDQEGDVNSLWSKCLNSYSSQVAPEQHGFSLIYDPSANIVRNGHDHSIPRNASPLNIDKGLATEASVEDKKLLGWIIGSSAGMVKTGPLMLDLQPDFMKNALTMPANCGRRSVLERRGPQRRLQLHARRRSPWTADEVYDQSLPAMVSNAV